ncbi:MAG: hypothetical protein V3V67_00320 [Myxococcota bacterium]
MTTANPASEMDRVRMQLIGRALAGVFWAALLLLVTLSSGILQ